MAAGTLLEEIADALVTAGIAEAVGLDIFVGNMPEATVPVVVALYDNGGLMNPTSPKSQPAVGVRVRASTYKAARQKAAEISNYMHQMAKTLSITRIIRATCQLPAHIGRDEEGRDLVVFNIELTVVSTDQTHSQTSTGYGGRKDSNLQD